MIAHFHINNKEVNDPNNYTELAIQLLYDRDNTSQQAVDQPRTTVSVTRWEWGLGDQIEANDGANEINLWLNDGFVTEGIPFRIDLEDEGVTETLFDGYLDPQTAIYDCDIVSIEAVEKKQVDWLNEVSDSATYERMFNDGEFTRSKFVSIPYIISTIPNAFETMLAIISIFSVLFILTSQLEEILELALGSLNPLQFMDIVKLILRGLYVATIFISLFIIVKQIINLLVQPVKYHEAMYTRDLLEIGAAHFGFTFKSSIYEPSSPFYNEVILPEKFNNNINSNKDDVLGWLTPNNILTFGYFIGTFGDLIRILKTKYNAKLYFIGNQLRLERRDFKQGAALYKIPSIDDEDDFRVNANELVANRVLEFVVDNNDKNTRQRYQGTLTQITAVAGTVLNPDFRLIKGSLRKTIALARGNRKNTLTTIERVIKGLAVAIDPVANTIVKIFNGAMSVFSTIINVANTILSVLTLVGITVTVQDIIDGFNNFLNNLGVPPIVAAVLSGNPIIVFTILNLDTDNLPTLTWTNIGKAIEERFGMLLVENDFISVPKTFIINEAAIPLSTDLSVLDIVFENTEFLYNNFHIIDSFVPTTDLPNANQYKIHDIDAIDFCFADFLNVKNSNFIKDFNDKDAELISLNWQVFNNGGASQASIEYKINELYTNNVREKVITRTGT